MQLHNVNYVITYSITVFKFIVISFFIDLKALSLDFLLQVASSHLMFFLRFNVIYVENSVFPHFQHLVPPLNTIL